MFKRAVKEAVVIILAAVAVALAVYAIRPDQTGPAPGAVAPGDAPPATAAGGIVEISIEAAFDGFESKAAVFADARHPADYAAGHIQGARNLYPSDPEPSLADLLAHLDPAAPIVTYCDGDGCHLATQLAELLILNGFTNVAYLKNGWSRWRARGYPVE